MRNGVREVGIKGLGWGATVGGLKPRTVGEVCRGGLLGKGAPAGRKTCGQGTKKSLASSLVVAIGREEALAQTTHFLTFHSSVISMRI